MGFGVAAGSGVILVSGGRSRGARTVLGSAGPAAQDAWGPRLTHPTFAQRSPHLLSLCPLRRGCQVNSTRVSFPPCKDNDLDQEQCFLMS